MCGDLKHVSEGTIAALEEARGTEQTGRGNCSDMLIEHQIQRFTRARED